MAQHHREHIDPPIGAVDGEGFELVDISVGGEVMRTVVQGMEWGFFQRRSGLSMLPRMLGLLHARHCNMRRGC